MTWQPTHFSICDGMGAIAISTDGRWVALQDERGDIFMGYHSDWRASLGAQNVSPFIVEWFEMQHSERWLPDEWRCGMGATCCSDPPQWLGWSIGDANESSQSHTPFIVVFEDGTARMVCEDCQDNLGLARAKRENAWRDRELAT